MTFALLDQLRGDGRPSFDGTEALAELAEGVGHVRRIARRLAVVEGQAGDGRNNHPGGDLPDT